MDSRIHPGAGTRRALGRLSFSFDYFLSRHGHRIDTGFMLFLANFGSASSTSQTRQEERMRAKAIPWGRGSKIALNGEGAERVFPKTSY